MRFFPSMLILLALCCALASPCSGAVVTDAAGRQATLPDAVRSVYAAGPRGIVTVYMLAPELLAGWCTPMTAPERRFIPEKYQKLPLLGGRYGLKGTMNAEVVLSARPDVVVLFASDKATNEAEITNAQRLEAQLHRPVLLLDGRLEDLPRSFRLLGAALDRRERAEKLAAYTERLLEDTARRVRDIPEDKRVRVYYAQGPRGLQTDPEGSWHSYVMNVVGGKNVAPVGILSGYGRTPVSLEQVIAWRPDVILVNNDAGSQGDVLGKMRQSASWRQVKAVREGRVHPLPHGPFNWFDRPPGPNRLGGILWLRHVLYPEIFGADCTAEAREFFSLFYQHALTEDDLAYLHLVPEAR